MKFDYLLFDLAASPALTSLLFGGVLVVLHYALVFKWPLSDLTWKKVDYAWLGVAAIGLLLASYQADHFLSARAVRDAEIPRTQMEYRILRDSIRANASSFCSPHARSLWSPPDYDAIVTEHQLLCDATRELDSAMPMEVSPPFPALPDTGYKTLPLNPRYETWFAENLTRQADRYESQRRRYLEFDASRQAAPLEEGFTILGPFFLALALALRITKVSGEIRNVTTRERLIAVSAATVDDEQH